MERKIKLELVDKNHYWMKGIYLIRIGRLRYIGKALVVGSRIYQHQGEINRTLAKYSHIVNFVPREEHKGTYVRIARHLHENPQITTGTVEVIERQVCSMALYYAEHNYLKEVKGNPDFCNGAFYSTRPKRGEDNLWDVVESNGQLEFFDPRIGGERIKSGGNPSVNKEFLKQINDIKQTINWRKQRLVEWVERVLGDNPTPKMRKAVVEYQMREIKRILSS